MARILLIACLAASSCKVKDPLYCDEDTPCTDPERPFCDLTGEYPASEGIGRTCIPDPQCPAGDCECTADMFLRCDGDVAFHCSSDGRSEIEIECAAGCDEGQGGCYCEPGSTSCSNNVALHCGSDGSVSSIEECVLGCAPDGTRCLDVDPANGLAEVLDMADTGPEVVIPDGATIQTMSPPFSSRGRKTEPTSGPST